MSRQRYLPWAFFQTKKVTKKSDRNKERKKSDSTRNLLLYFLRFLLVFLFFASSSFQLVKNAIEAIMTERKKDNNTQKKQYLFTFLLLLDSLREFSETKMEMCSKGHILKDNNFSFFSYCLFCFASLSRLQILILFRYCVICGK